MVFDEFIMLFLVQVLLSKLLIRHFVFQDEIASNDHFMCYGSEGCFLTHSWYEGVILTPQVGIFSFDGRPGTFNHHGFEVIITMPQSRSFFYLHFLFGQGKAQTKPQGVCVREIDPYQYPTQQ